MSLIIGAASTSAQTSGRYAMPGTGVSAPGTASFLGPIGGIIGTIAKTLPGPVGTIATGITSIFGGGDKTKPAPLPPINPPFAGPPGVGVSTPYGRVSAFEPSTNGAGMKLACPNGMHPNKTGYFLKSGEYVAPGSKCVRNRRRNPLNPRALDRAIGRIEAGKKASKRLSRITVRKAC